MTREANMGAIWKKIFCYAIEEIFILGVGMRTADAPFSSSDSAVAEIPWTQKTAKKLARIKSMSIVLVIMVIDAGVGSRVWKKRG